MNLGPVSPRSFITFPSQPKDPELGNSILSSIEAQLDQASGIDFAKTRAKASEYTLRGFQGKQEISMTFPGPPPGYAERAASICAGVSALAIPSVHFVTSSGEAPAAGPGSEVLRNIQSQLEKWPSWQQPTVRISSPGQEDRTLVLQPKNDRERADLINRNVSSLASELAATEWRISRT